MPPNLGTFEFTAKLDARRVLDVIAALDMLRGLLVDDYGHVWTDEERATLANAVDACERQNLVIEPAP